MDGHISHPAIVNGTAHTHEQRTFSIVCHRFSRVLFGLSILANRQGQGLSTQRRFGSVAASILSVATPRRPRRPPRAHRRQPKRRTCHTRSLTISLNKTKSRHSNSFPIQSNGKEERKQKKKKQKNAFAHKPGTAGSEHTKNKLL